MSYQLCKEFPAFTPLIIERETYHKIVTLYANVRKLQIRNGDSDTTAQPKVIRRKAGDDWF